MPQKLTHAVLAGAAASLVYAQDGYTPLVSRDIPYSERPYKVDTVASGRGPQYGYNNCSSETEGPDSLCQTAFFNSLEDFCLWGLPELDTVGNTEARAIAWCTQEGHGTRVMPAGTIKAAQWIVTDSYVQVTGQLEQQNINIEADDAGGEMDPAGEDQRGNPLGGLVYTTAFGGSEEEPTQVTWWTNFIGNNYFCMKACVPGSDNEARNCEHVYDRVGCFVNVVSDGYFNTGTYETCEGEVGLPVGVYSGDDGELSTWYQPPEGEEIGTLPYDTASLIPASSQCSTPSSLAAAFQDNSTESASSMSNSGSASASASASATRSAASDASEDTASSATPTASADNEEDLAAAADETTGADSGAVMSVKMALGSVAVGLMALCFTS